MILRHSNGSTTVMGSAMLLVLASISAPCFSQGQQDTTKPVVLPGKVLNALKARFPKAVIDKQTKEEEDGKVIYDIEFKQDSLKFEADYYEDGSLHNWERAIPRKDLPAAVIGAVEKKYPKATMKEVMEITEVKGGKEVLEGYEIVLDAADKKEYEITVAPDGKVLEDSGDEK